MKSYFITDLILKDIDGVYAELTSDFGYYSQRLDCEIWVSKGFITDLESVPVLRSKSKRAGVIHDYLSRLDAYPYVSKAMAAKIYLETMETRDRIYYTNAPWFNRVWLCVYRHFKSNFVKYVPDFVYWKKHKINATYEEMWNG